MNFATSMIACTGTKVFVRFQLLLHGAVHAGDDDQGSHCIYLRIIHTSLRTR